MYLEICHSIVISDEAVAVLVSFMLWPLLTLTHFLSSFSDNFSLCHIAFSSSLPPRYYLIFSYFFLETIKFSCYLFKRITTLFYDFCISQVFAALARTAFVLFIGRQIWNFLLFPTSFRFSLPCRSLHFLCPKFRFPKGEAMWWYGNGAFSKFIPDRWK